MNNISKKVYNNSTTPTESLYLAGYQYISNVLQFFPTAEGYVNNTVVSDINQYSYVYNYTDHLGNIRLSYKKNGTALQILEENNYYPFGLKHTYYNTTNAQPNYKYKYNSKEYQDELGLNFYDYGARNYDASIGRWMNVDPLSEKYRRLTSYNYCMNNPLRFIDPTGMSNDDVILTGTKTKEALAELQKSVGNDVTLTMNENGKVEYTRNGEGPLNKNTNDLVGAIDDHTVTAEVNTSNNDYASNGDPLIGNQMGADVNADGTATGKQEINPEALSRMDNINGLPGQTTLHETMEAYAVGNTAKNTGQNIAAATWADGGNPNSPYRLAHDNVVPQSGEVYILNQNNKTLISGSPSNRVEWAKEKSNTSELRYATRPSSTGSVTIFHTIKVK